MLRIALFLATNLAILIVASITFRILGVDQYLMASGMGNMQGLLIFCFIFGMGKALGASDWKIPTSGMPIPALSANSFTVLSNHCSPALCGWSMT